MYKLEMIDNITPINFYEYYEDLRNTEISFDGLKQTETFNLEILRLRKLHRKRIIKELLEIDEITNIWRLSGDCGLFLKVEIGSIELFNPLIEEKISQIKGIKIVETCFITDVIK